MIPSLAALLSHRQTYFSQNGEDGLLEYVLERIPARTNWCVEFGAWDGRYLSNTFHFIHDKGYQAVLIEGDAGKCETLRANMQSFPVVCLNRWVRPDGPDSLDSILAGTPIPEDFDMLSIDIDSDDYLVWQSLVKYRPKVVIVEINIRDKPGVRRVNTPGSPLVWGESGSSITSMTDLAGRKGYALIANVGCNAIFVHREFLGLFHEKEPTPAEVFLYEGHTLRELTPREIKGLGWKVATVRFLKECARRLKFWEKPARTP